MNLLTECELMAKCDPGGAEIEDAEIQRWQNLFGLDRAEARMQIEQNQSNLNCCRLTQEHWATIEDQHPQHSKQSYEHAIALQARHRSSSDGERKPTNLTVVQATAEFLFKLEAPLDTGNKIGAATGLSRLPKTYFGSSELTTEAAFVIVDRQTQDKIRTVFSQPWTFIPHRKAPKTLIDCAPYPKLGIEGSLPQLRSSGAPCKPLQNEYPVWYFFYGTLAEPERLQRLLQLPTASILDLASVANGLSVTFGKYCRLVNGGGDVMGKAYLVQSQEHEDLLRYYETDFYEVVRCDISIVPLTSLGPG